MNSSLPSQLPPLPEDFKASLRSLEGVDADALCLALDTPPAVAVRLNPYKPMDCDIFSQIADGAVAWCGEGRYLAERPLFTLMPEMHAGAFYVQDASSMIHAGLARGIVDAEGGRPLSVLDVCAAPGGKTTAIMGALPPGSAMIANEYSPQRVKALEENMVKYGSPDMAVTCGDARNWGGCAETFDMVVVDAPCSGEGMMRKEEVARTQWSPGLVESCARTQREILDSVVRTLRPGGWLIYSTCTFNRAEDEEMARYLVEHHGLVPVMDQILDKSVAESVPRGLDPDIPSLRFMPHLTRGEGLFVTVLRRPGEDAGEDVPTRIPPAPKPKGKGKRQEKGGSMPDAESVCGKWINGSYAPLVWKSVGDTVRVIPARVASLLERLPKGVRLLGAGVEVATLKGRDLVPASPLALSTILDRGAFPEVPLSREDAVRYLRHESLTLPPDTPRGFVLVSHNGIPLGWMKNIGTRANNLWPQAWRIRMQ